MFVSGTSTHHVGKVAEKLMGVAPSASAVSRLNQTLIEQYEAWRERPLHTHYRVVYLDGIHFTVRHGAKTDATIILTALGVDLEGSREVLAFRASAEESKDGWNGLLQDLRTRGVSHIDLIVTDGHDGLLAALADLFPATLRQRCLVHKQPSADERHSQTGTTRGQHRMGGDLQAGEQGGGTAQPGRLQSQISEALSRSRSQPLRRRRAFTHVLRLPTSHASLHSQYECD